MTTASITSEELLNIFNDSHEAADRFMYDIYRRLDWFLSVRQDNLRSYISKQSKRPKWLDNLISSMNGVCNVNELQHKLRAVENYRNLLKKNTTSHNLYLFYDEMRAMSEVLPDREYKGSFEYAVTLEMLLYCSKIVSINITSLRECDGCCIMAFDYILNDSTDGKVHQTYLKMPYYRTTNKSHFEDKCNTLAFYHTLSA